jgi:Uma2 family endonuclease
MTALASTQYSFEDYLAIERELDTRNEYIGGQVYAMTGAKENHNLIVVNLAAELRARFKQRPCRVFANDMKVRINLADASTYPDVLALCGEREFHDQRKDIICNPSLIVEVLSPSTEAHDRGDKFALYRRLPSLQDYLLISQERMAAELYTRQADGRWLMSEFNQEQQVIRLDSVDCEVPMAEIYDKVEFELQDTPRVFPRRS